MTDLLDKEIWHSMSSAPRDGTEIEGLYLEDNLTDIVEWVQEGRCCIGGPRAGSYPPGWNSVDIRLPVDPPDFWRHKIK